MIIETREAYLQRISDRIGDSDDDISFLEDMTDTYDSLAGAGSQEEIQRLTAENEELRRKYKERFFSPPADPDPDPEPKEVEVKTKFEELFTEGSI